MHFSAAEPISRTLWLFSAGIAIVLLSLWIPYIPGWVTFVHSWRVETFASIFLVVALAVAAFRSKAGDVLAAFSPEERRFIIYPILALILWSVASALWAESWRSAFHHAFVWSEYLVFYCLLRNLLDAEEKEDQFLFVLAGVLAIYALPAVAGYVSVQIFGGLNTLGVRFSRFGEQAIVLLPILIVVTILQWKKLRWIGTVSIASAWLLVLCSMSRTTIFLAVVVTSAAVLSLVLSGRSRGNRTAIAITLAIFIAVPFLLHTPSLFSQADSSPVAQRFSDSAGLSDSNGFRKLMIALSLEMIVDKPLTGIGADNFGFQVHKYREAFAQKDPDNALLAYAENEVPERAHNEYLQIAAELGIVGVAIFCWFLVGIAILARRSVARIRQMPIVALAAVIGILAFLAAGLVTSYSFRFIQNGFFFFFALAIAAKYLFATKMAEERSESYPRISVRLAAVCGIVLCLLSTLYSVTRVASVILQEQAGVTPDKEAAAAMYQDSSMLDPENPVVFKSSGVRALRDGDFEKSARLLERSVEMGESTSTSYSYLASAYLLAGDPQSAEGTLRNAAAMYPKSVFVQARLSAMLQANGKHDEASKVFEKAASLDQKAAATWLTLLTKGSGEVTSRAIDPSSGIIPVMDLMPQSGMYAVMNERLIMHPEEQKFSMFKAQN